MKFGISHGIIPAWYELSFPNLPTLSLRIHRIALEHMMKTDWTKAPGVSFTKKTYGLTSFSPPTEQRCGFNEVFVRSESCHRDWIQWNCRLPRMKASEGVPEDSREYIMAIRSTLWLFSTSLWLFEGNTQWYQPQLMLIEGICLPTDDRMSSGSLSVTLSPSTIKWLSKQSPDVHIKQIVDAMSVASDFMWKCNSDSGRFGALFRKPKWLNMDVPGNACGLDPESYFEESLEDGYTLQPHNVDSSLQQLTFLVGLAKLHDLVRQQE